MHLWEIIQPEQPACSFPCRSFDLPIDVAVVVEQQQQRAAEHMSNATQGARADYRGIVVFRPGLLRPINKFNNSKNGPIIFLSIIPGFVKTLPQNIVFRGVCVSQTPGPAGVVRQPFSAMVRVRKAQRRRVQAPCRGRRKLSLQFSSRDEGNGLRVQKTTKQSKPPRDSHRNLELERHPSLRCVLAPTGLLWSRCRPTLRP